MNIQRGEGNVLNIVAPSTLTSGTPIKIGAKLFGVPVADAASGAQAALAVEGQFALPKVGGGGITFLIGAKVYWNQSTAKCTATATDDLIGVCVVAAADADTSVQTKINGQLQDAVDADGIAGAASGTYAGHLFRTSGTAIAFKKANMAATAAPSATDDSAADYAIGSFWLDTTNDRAYICLDATATAAVWREISHQKDNLAAAAAPGATDDSAAGYSVGSRWLDTTNDRAYVCIDATATAAAWLVMGAPIKAGASQIDSGQSAKVVAVGAAYNGFPVNVTVKSTAAGAVVGAGVAPMLKGAIAAGDLTVTMVDALSGNVANVSQNLPFHYVIVGTV